MNPHLRDGNFGALPWAQKKKKGEMLVIAKLLKKKKKGGEHGSVPYLSVK